MPFVGELEWASNHEGAQLRSGRQILGPNEERSVISHLALSVRAPVCCDLYSIRTVCIVKVQFTVLVHKLWMVEGSWYCNVTGRVQMLPEGQCKTYPVALTMNGYSAFHFVDEAMSPQCKTWSRSR